LGEDQAPVVLKGECVAQYPVPSDVYHYLVGNPTVSGAELARQTGLARRSAQRYRRKFLDGDAYPRTREQRVIAQSILEYEEAEEEDSFDPYDFINLAPQLVRERQRKDPVITHDKFTLDVDHPIGVIFVSCMHLGGRYTAYEEFRDIYERALRIPNLYWGSLGDDIEGFLAQFPDQMAIIDQLIDVDHQYEVLEVVLSRLADMNKLLFGCGSQHGGKWESRSKGKNTVKDMYRDMHVPFFDGVGYVRFEIGQQTYFIALAHELPGYSQYNPNHSHARASRFRFPNAHVVVAGDKHFPAVQYYPAFVDEYLIGNRSTPYVWLLQSGTAKEGPDKYTVQNWPRGRLGWPIVIFYPNQDRIEVTMYLDRVEEILGVSALEKVA